MDNGQTGFEKQIRRGLNFAIRSIEVEQPNTQIDGEARDRAWNILNYAYKYPQTWADTYTLLQLMIPKMEMAGYRKKWGETLKTAANVSQSVDDRAAYAELSLAIGYLELLCSELNLAEKWFQQSAAYFAELGDKAGRGRVLNRLAVVELRRQNYGVSQRLAQEATDILPKAHIDYANSYYVFGTICGAQKKWREAEAHYRTGLSIWQSVGDQRRTAWALSHVGQALRGQGKAHDAADCYEKVMGIFSQIHDPANQAIAEMNMANLHSQCKEYEQATTLLLRSRKVFLELGDDLNLARTSINLGINYINLRNWGQAKTFCEESVSLWECLGITASLCNALDALGEVFIAIREFSQAISILERGLELLESIKEHPTYNELRSELSGHLEEAYGGREG